MRLAAKNRSRGAHGDGHDATGSAARSPCMALPLLIVGAFMLFLFLFNMWGAAAPAGGAPPATPAALHSMIAPIGTAPDLDRRKVALGRALFHDPRLSGAGDTSCSTCHDLATNGAQSGPRQTMLDAPTLFNVGLNFRYGWEGRFRTLEAQARATLASRMMARDVPLDIIVERLRRDGAMRGAFHASYGRDPDLAAIADAIATFERSLVTPDSRFDRWLAGDRSALTREEGAGYDVFRRLGCASCHQGRNIGGNLYQRQGIFRRLASPKPAVVRVPSLRNVAVTAPYFHDGSAPTLEAAIWRMGAAQLNQELTDDEVRLIAAYLRTLTGSYEGRVLTAPR